MNHSELKNSINGIICFGDSILAGTGASDRQFGSAKLVKAATAIPVSLKSRNWDTSQMGLQRIDIDVLAQRSYSHVIVLFGNNDSWINKNGKPYIELEKFETNINQILDLISRNGQIPIVCNLQPIDPIKFAMALSEDFQVVKQFKIDPVEWQKKYSDRIEVICRQKKHYFIDIRKVLNQSISAVISSDGIHPNDKGHKIIANCILSTLLQIDSSLQLAVI